MEELKAPEKLYLHPTVKGNVGASWLTFPLTNEDVEYIRTDTVIGWLKDCSTNKDFNGDTCVDEDLFNTMVEDFKNYIKGE